MEKMTDDIKSMIGNVMEKKYIVKTMDNTKHEWGIQELTTYLISNQVKEIHLFKEAQDLKLELYTGEEKLQ